MFTLCRHGSIEPDELAAALRDYVVVDLRRAREWEAGHVPGAVHAPLAVLRAGWRPADARLPVAVFGDDAGDVAAAVSVLRDSGVDAVTIEGGAAAWAAAGHCLVTNHR